MTTPLTEHERTLLMRMAHRPVDEPAMAQTGSDAWLHYRAIPLILRENIRLDITRRWFLEREDFDADGWLGADGHPEDAPCLCSARNDGHERDCPQVLCMDLRERDIVNDYAATAAQHRINRQPGDLV